MQQRAIGILALAAIIALAACGGGGPSSSTAPTNVRTQAGDGYVTVTWDFGGEASSFGIHRETIGTASLGAQALERIDTVEDGSARTYEDIRVDSSATYAYGVSVDGGEPVPAGGSGVSPEPGNVLRVLFGTAVPDGASVAIVSDPPGIDCTQAGQPGCQAAFATIADVVLTVDTSPGTAAAWENCDSATSGMCQVSMATSRTVTVDFLPANTLSVNVLPPGTGRVESTIDLAPNPNVDCTDDCSYDYPSNLRVYLSAQPLDADTYELADWGGACSTFTGSTCNLQMNASKAISAQFQLIPPAIQSFAAVPARLTAGGSSTLSWSVTGGGDIGADELSISIEPEVGAVTSRTGSVEVTPAATTVYTLTATNATDTVSETRTVVVGSGALIESFTATPEAINPDGTSTLEWTVSGTDSDESPLTLTLDPGGIDVTGTESYPVDPGDDTTYILTAENEFGSDTDTAEVRVGNAPTIGSFAPADAFITLDQSTVLEWDVTGPGDIMLTLDPGNRNVTGATSAPVDPETTTTYTLTAVSEFGTTIDTTIVNVGAAPSISAFDASPSFVPTGESITLTWDVVGDGMIELVLNPDGIDVTGDESIVVTPTATTDYQLVASSEYGDASADERVEVGDKPTIESFTADDATVVSGAPVQLTWSVSGEDELTLEPLGRDVTGLSGTTVNPESDVTYTLRATNAFGFVTDPLPVDVGLAPAITSFTATPSEVTAGDPVLLEWAVDGDGPFTYSIDESVGTVSGTSTTVNPTSTTTYTLTASSPYGSPDSMDEVVTVVDATTAVAPTASTCDGTAVSASCIVTISLSNTVEVYEGLEFDFASASFDLTDASTSTETSGCLIDAGTNTVIMACNTAFGEGDVASLSVQRNASTASTFQTSNAYVALDDQSKTAVGGGILAVAATD